MKKRTLYRIAMTGIFLLFGGLSASAQTHERVMTVKVPFDFHVSKRLLPAGNYTITRATRMPGLLLIQCPEQKIAFFVLANPRTLSDGRKRGSLTFQDYGDVRLLSEIRPLGEVGFTLMNSKAESRLAQRTVGGTIRVSPEAPKTDN